MKAASEYLAGHLMLVLIAALIALLGAVLNRQLAAMSNMQAQQNEALSRIEQQVTDDQASWNDQQSEITAIQAEQVNHERRITVLEQRR